jgi:hypothetical protein
MSRGDGPDVSRRGVVGVLGALLLGPGDAAGDPSAVGVGGGATAAERVEEAYVAPSKAALPVPASAPGVGLTDDGLYRSPGDSDRWEALEGRPTDDRPSTGGESPVSDDVRVVAPGEDLQSAVDSLPDGGRIVVANGVHRLSAPLALPSNVTLVGRSLDGAILVPDGLSGAVIESRDEDYVRIRNLKIDGQNAGVDGVRFANATSEPSHHLLEDVHVVNCRHGIVFDDVEDSWIRRGRVGGCDVGIRHAVAGGFGSVAGTHVVDCRDHSVRTGTRMLSLRDVVLGSADADHHVDVGADARQLGFDGCWVENAPPVVDTGRHVLEQLRAHACRFLIGGGEAGFRGEYNHVDLGSTTVADSDGERVELFASEPGRVSGNNLKLAGAAEWTNRGFANALSGIQGGRRGTDGFSTSHPVSVRQSFVEEPVAAGATSTTIDLPDGEPDAGYGVMISPGWTTSYAVAAKRRDGFDLDFETPAPSDGGTLDCWVYRGD